MADHVNKLKQAIAIVVKRQLKENHDDTLAEKLISHIQKLLRTANSLDRAEYNQLLHVIVQLLDHTSPEPVALRLLALFLSSDNKFQSATEATEMALEKFASAAACVNASSDLSVQSALIQSLAMFSDTDWLVTGQLYSLPPVSFPRIIYKLMTDSPSYFVRNESEQLLAKLFTSNRFCSEMVPSTQSSHLTEIMHMITANPDEKNLRFLKLLLERTMMRRPLVKANMQEQIMKQFENYCNSEHPDEKIIHLFCHILGMFILRPDAVESVFSICLKRNDLKSLVIYCSRLLQVDREYINKWLLYALYALVARTERRGEIGEQMLASQREKSFVERHADNGVIMTVLSLMPHVFRNVDEKGALVVDALHVFLQTKLSDTRKLFENRKVISESVVCLYKCSQEDLIVEADFNPILCNLILEAEKSSCHTIELLTIARNLWNKRIVLNLFGKVAVDPILDSMSQLLSRDRFHQPLQNWDSDEKDSCEKNMEILELSLDALSQLTGNSSFGENPQFLQVIRSLWSLHHDNVTFLTAVFPIIFALDTLASEEELIKFGWQKHVHIPDLVIKLLERSDDCLSLKIVKTLRENIERLNYLRLKRPDAYYGILSALCLTSLRVVESELQCETFAFIVEILNPGSKDDVKLLYSCGLMTTAMAVMQSDLYSSNDVRISAFEISELIRLCIRCEDLNERSLLQLLSEATRPTIFESVERQPPEKTALVQQNDKVDAINNLFKEFQSQPTQDMIMELNCREGNHKNGVSIIRCSAVSTIDLKQLAQFYTGETHYPESENLSDSIIEDILAAKECPNAAAIDCY